MTRGQARRLQRMYRVDQQAAGGATRADVLALGPQLLYDCTDNATMWQDEAASVAVAATNDPVAYLEDLSGNGEHLIIPTGETTRRPLRSANGIIFDGVNDGIWKQTFGAVSLSVPYTLIFAFKFIANASGRYLFAGPGLSGYGPGFYNGGSSTFRMDPPSANYWTAADDTNNHILTVRVAGTGVAQAEINYDGVDQGALDNYQNPSLTGLAFGGSYAGPFTLRANAEMQKFAAFSGTLSDTNMDTVEEWMNDQGVLP